MAYATINYHHGVGHTGTYVFDPESSVTPIGTWEREIDALEFILQRAFLDNVDIITVLAGSYPENTRKVGEIIYQMVSGRVTRDTI